MGEFCFIIIFGFVLLAAPSEYESENGRSTKSPTAIRGDGDDDDNEETKKRAHRKK